MFYTIVDGAGNVVAAGEGNAPPANALVLPGETAQSLIGYAQNNSAPNANDGTQWQAQVFNHLSANLIKVLGDGDVDLLPRTDDQLLTAFKNIIAANVEQITPASVIAGLTALRTETYRPGYRAGGDYVLGGGDADRGAYAGQQWQVINADNTLGDRYFWTNGAGATAADRRNAGRWRLMSGAVQIWRRGEAANGAGSAGELRNIPAEYRHYVGDGSAAERQWQWKHFRRLYACQNADSVTVNSHTSGGMSVDAWLGGAAWEFVGNTGGDPNDETFYITRTDNSGFAYQHGAGYANNDSTIDAIWGEL